MQIEQINFSTNWNKKLDCSAFTTIRLRNDNKYKAKEHYELNLNKKFIGTGFCIDIKHFWLKDINDFIAYLDTGYDKEEFKEILKKMYPKVDFTKTQLSIILLKKIK